MYIKVGSATHLDVLPMVLPMVLEFATRGANRNPLRYYIFNLETLVL